MKEAWTAEGVAEQLGARRSGSGWVGRCPCHDDQNASLSISEGSTGRVLVKCHTGCDQNAVFEAVSKVMSAGGGASASPPVVPNGKGKVVAAYDYLDANGHELYQVVRTEPKGFYQRRRNPASDPGEPQWIRNMDGVTRVLYRLPEVATAVALQREGKYLEPIFVVEGERDADALAAFGLMATTNSGGAAATWTTDYTETLRGAAFVTVIPDNDAPGLKHAEAVASALLGAVDSVNMLMLPGLPDKGDVSDWIAAGGTKDELLCLAADAPTYVPKPKGRHLELVPFSRIPRKKVSWLWPMFLPYGKLVMMDGDPGLGKSTLALDIAARVTKGEEWPDGAEGCTQAGVLIMSAEDDPEDTIGPRLMAADADMEQVFHDKFSMDGARDEPTICDVDIALIEERVKKYVIKLVIIDPMTAFLDGNVKVYVDHDVRRALLPLKGLAERTGCCVLVIRHWTKQSNSNAMHRGGGSIGIIGAARVALAVGYDPDDENENRNARKRVLAVAKTNVGAFPKAREFCLEWIQEHDACRIRWLGASKHTADALSQGPKAKNKRVVAKELILDLLAGGRREKVEDVEAEAKALNISMKTLQRAREDLEEELKGAIPHKSEDGTYWYWQLPAPYTDGHLPMKHEEGGGHLPMRNES